MLIFEKDFLENPYLSDSYRGAPGNKSLSVRQPKIVLLENWYLFGEHINIAPGKIVFVQLAHEVSWKTPEKGAPKRTDIFENIPASEK